MKPRIKPQPKTVQVRIARKVTVWEEATITMLESEYCASDDSTIAEERVAPGDWQEMDRIEGPYSTYIVGEES